MSNSPRGGFAVVGGAKPARTLPGRLLETAGGVNGFVGSRLRRLIDSNP
ncbi:MAG: hypothetical protein IT581_00700 [Verrucomicrobiales bacterium]|nr:hypothetical protein [Verrucomicrobiales bacterium]